MGEARLIGQDFVHQDMEKIKVIQESFKTAQKGHESYIDVRRRELEFEEGDIVYLKISFLEGVVIFGKKGM
ncbi:hypothetical protein, partial [Acinetobacter baumannii]|uniref:hypothetical protein n=1 Tax=Acinetobacter baumannii TaxID=470 RepID=UPI00339B2B26